MGERIVNEMYPHNIFNIYLFGHSIPVTDTIIVMWVIMAFLIITAIIFTRKLNTIPDNKQNIVESVVEFVNNLAKSMIGHHWKPFAPYLGSVILFLAFSNIISVFNILPWELLYEKTHILAFEHFGIRPPTKDINVTACLGIMSISIVLFSGIWYKKIPGFLKSFIQPSFIVAPFKILDYFTRPMSLCLRLFGNILGAFIIMALLYQFFPPIIPAFFGIYFDLFDGLLQAYVFVFLTSIYIAEAIE